MWYLGNVGFYQGIRFITILCSQFKLALQLFGIVECFTCCMTFDPVYHQRRVRCSHICLLSIPNFSYYKKNKIKKYKNSQYHLLRLKCCRPRI